LLEPVEILARQASKESDETWEVAALEAAAAEEPPVPDRIVAFFDVQPAVPISKTRPINPVPTIILFIDTIPPAPQ